jgi:hypothetical protein
MNNRKTIGYYILDRSPNSEILYIWKSYLTLEIVKQDKCSKYSEFSKLLCLMPKWTIFQLYHGKNKFQLLRWRCPLYNMFSWVLCSIYGNYHIEVKCLLHLLYFSSAISAIKYLLNMDWYFSHDDHISNTTFDDIELTNMI